MALNTFNTHLSDVGQRLQELQQVTSNIEALLNRHDHNDYGSLIASDFDGRLVTKTQYDNALVTISNLIDTFMPAGNGTNIDQYLYEVPDGS